MKSKTRIIRYCRRKAAALRFGVSLMVIFSIAGGCSGSLPLPLTKDAVEAGLQSPDKETLRLLAGKIHHSLLQSVHMKPDKGLTPDGAAILAVLVKPSLRAARDKKALADAQVLAAGLLPNPELSLSLERPSGSNSRGRVDAFGLGLGWDISSLLLFSFENRKAGLERNAILLDIAWQEGQLAQAMIGLELATGLYRIPGLNPTPASISTVSQEKVTP